MTQLRKQPPPEGMLVAGEITGCYGIKGWLKVHAFTDPPENLLAFPVWWLRSGAGQNEVVIDQGRHHGRGLVVHIRGVDDRTAAETLRGQELLVEESQLPALEEGDYYWHQLTGLEVWCRDGNDETLLGSVDHMLETGANDVIVVRPGPGSVDEQERLIPYLPGQTVREVDLQRGRMTVDWFVDA